MTVQCIQACVSFNPYEFSENWDCLYFFKGQKHNAYDYRDAGSELHHTLGSNAIVFRKNIFFVNRGLEHVVGNFATTLFIIPFIGIGVIILFIFIKGLS